MVLATDPSPPRVTGLPPGSRERLLRPLNPPGPVTALVMVLVVALIVWSMVGVEFSLVRMVRGLPLMADFLGNLWPPNSAYWTKMLPAILDTLQMAVVGLIVAMILAAPLAVLAARNTTPHLAVYGLARALLNIDRGIPSLVWAIVIVAALGFGPYSGALALGVAGMGTLGKLYAEAIEAINPRPVEAMRATGAGPLQVFSFGILPQALPLLVSYTLLDFESNVRSATILGIVGAGGIGFELQASFSQFKFDEVCTILLQILIMVTLIDRLSAVIRGRLI